MKFIDPDGKSPVIPIAYEAIVYIVGTLGVGYLLYEYRDEITFTLSKPGVNQQLNKGYAPDPRWVRREENLAQEMEAKQAETTNKISTGGHNPKNSDGDFKPDYSKKFGKAACAIAGAAAGGVLGSQIGGSEDARKDINENEDAQVGGNEGNSSFNLDKFIEDAMLAGAKVRYF